MIGAITLSYNQIYCQILFYFKKKNYLNGNLEKIREFDSFFFEKIKIKREFDLNIENGLKKKKKDIS